MFRELGIVSIPVKNQEQSREFYADILACTVEQDMPFGPGADTKWLKLSLPGVATKLVLATWFPQMSPGSLQGLVLIVDDIAKAHAILRKRGLEISEVVQRPYGREATFRDPDGNGWVLQQPASSP